MPLSTGVDGADDANDFSQAALLRIFIKRILSSIIYAGTVISALASKKNATVT